MILILTSELPRFRRSIKLDIKEMGSEDSRWMKLAQDHIHWWSLVLMVLSFWAMLPEN